MEKPPSTPPIVQATLTEQEQVYDEVPTPDNNEKSEIDISMGYVLFWAIVLGLAMNWLGMYLKISMGFVSVGIGPMAVLLIGRQILRRKNAASRQNLTTIIIAYGATRAAEASVGLLFLLWLATNSSFFGLSFVPPWWLLPSQEVVTSRSLLTTEWLVPLAVHYFLMLVPGILGLFFGWHMKDSFIHDNEAYPFPGVISQNSQVAVLTDEAETKGPLFWKVARWGFIISLVTILVPGLFVIDLSNVSAGYIFGIMLGPVGLALLAAGIIVGKSKITIVPLLVSVLAYSILGGFLVSNPGTTDFYEYFTLLLQDFYFVPTLGLMLGGLILGPIFWGLLSSLFSRNSEKESLLEDEKEIPEVEGSHDGKSRQSILSVLRNHYKLLGTFAVIYFVMVAYVQFLDIIPTAPLWVISILIFWNIVLGGLVNGYLVTMGTAKSNSAFSPPFIFDVLPIFLAGGAGFTSYVAIPSAETDGSAGIVASQKLAMLNGVSERNALKAYLAGYMATSLTTPIFALLMWRAFGIGTTSFPAPAFPVQGAILASFASRDVSSFINLQQLFIALILAILLSRFGSDLIFGIVIGMLFPPHMAMPMAAGGLIRVWMDRKYDHEKSKDLSSTIGPAVAVGASFVIPIMILLALL